MSILTSSSISTQAVLLRIRLRTYLNLVLQTSGCHNLGLTFQEMNNRRIGILFSTTLTETNVLKTREFTTIWNVEQRFLEDLNVITTQWVLLDRNFKGIPNTLYSILTWIHFLNRYHVACSTFKQKHCKMLYCSTSKDISLMLLIFLMDYLEIMYVLPIAWLLTHGDKEHSQQKGYN